MNLDINYYYYYYYFEMRYQLLVKRKEENKARTDFLQMNIESNPKHFRPGITGSHSTRGKESKDRSPPNVP